MNDCKSSAKMTENPEDIELLAVLNRTKCPPGGWKWTDPETGTKVETIAYVDLVRRVNSYMEANNIPQPDNWALILDDEICRQNGIEDTHCGQPDKPKEIPVDRKLQPHDLLNFLKTVRQWAAKGFKFVDQAEAERRAAICATCPMNVEVPGCSGCQGILAYVRDALNRRANHRGLEPRITSEDKRLQNCEVCGCVLEVKVHLPMDVATYAKPPGGRTYPSHCWMHQNQLDDSNED